ncbi:MAG: replication-relaxation family protein [Candidatus Dormibacteraeota bacterium]|nr:replication-relaxation family protein [Candidatus Dormibacteraeota bacterium]
MPEIEPGENRESDPLALKWFQAEGRTIFVRPQDWEEAAAQGAGAEARPRDGLAGALLRDRRRARDMAVLACLGQHHYLTTGHLEALFAGGYGHENRLAQRLSRKLEEWGLLTRWYQMVPPVEKGGWRRQCDVFLLTARGAHALARYRRIDPKPLKRRAFSAFHFAYHLEHALGTNGFFASLILASRRLPDQGLYHWLGDDGVRRAYADEDPELSPDGFGRYLTEEAEIGFHLEWDAGTEPPQRLRSKARAALDTARGHVLWVAPSSAREQTIRSALERASESGGRVAGFWTTNVGLLRGHGPLGEVWRGLEQDDRRQLAVLPGRARSALRIGDCLGKPGWWERRPGGTEGM